MSGFIEGENRHQSTLFPEALDDYVAEDNPARVIDVFIDKLDISGLGFKAEPSHTGRPGYNPRLMLKLCLLYTSPSPRDGLLSRMPSSA